MSARRAVVDTNVVVSALLSPRGAPAQVLGAIQHGRLTPVLSLDVFGEYQDVLGRARFRFPPAKVRDVLTLFLHDGLMLQPGPASTAGLPDADDAPFVALARLGACPLVTGNIRHFPKKLGLQVMTPRQWLEAEA